MGNRDARRLGVVQVAAQGKITNREGAEALAMSLRQFKRLRSRVRMQGPRGLVHGNRGRPSARRIDEALRQRVVELLSGAVKLNDHHIADLLSAAGQRVSTATVRRLRPALKLPPSDADDRPNTGGGANGSHGRGCTGLSRSVHPASQRGAAAHSGRVGKRVPLRPRTLERILACRHTRVVARDNTVSIPGRWVQIPPGPHRRS